MDKIKNIKFHQAKTVEWVGSNYGFSLRLNLDRFTAAVAMLNEDQVVSLHDGLVEYLTICQQRRQQQVAPKNPT